ncbi:class F sortase [Micromonospora olivasterospora]|uniref:Sortase family protein n=1 Tax=Micromonospora olivasterospora TaxID=1880 RepID=A0A562I5E0_MICOL|nr:class F sortase [Micromonospora olivasterospora]TWH66231.1 sortase family protein [Micromonospora olivasterospora]
MGPWPDATATPAGGRHGRPWRAAGAAVVIVLGMVGAGLLGASHRTAPPVRPPQPLAQASPDVPGPTGSFREQQQPAEGTGGPADASRSAAPSLDRATPTTISIPRIGVRAQLMTLGTNPDGTVQVPPLDQAQKAGWYSPGPSPGEIGNAVIVGHVDSAKIGGPAVFFELGALRPGDVITVSRADGRQVSFTVDSVKSYPKTNFPSEVVYGPNDQAGLRVVTCGGQFDQNAGSYLNNVIVFATMTS